MSRRALTLTLQPAGGGLSLGLQAASGCLQLDFAPVLRGPPGPPGPPGDGSGGTLTPGAIGALAAAMRLAEFDTEPARAQARANLGLQTIDGGTF